MAWRGLGRVGAAVAVASMLGAAGAEAACATGSELSGLRARVLQTELMVAALSCGESARYNAFVTRFRNELQAESKRMQAYFSRVYGRRATKELNAFVTELANNSSQRSVGQAGTFCPQAAALFDSVMALEPKQLRTFAASQSFADLHGVDACEPVREARAETSSTLLTQVKLPAEKPVR